MTKRTKAKPRGLAGRRPIADKLVKKMRGYLSAKVVDLTAVREGRENAAALQRTATSLDEPADLHPGHAIYAHAQHQASIMAEQFMALPEMARFARLLGNAEDAYMPSGPPVSPVTSSFFNLWALFDACVGLGRETLGTTTLAVGKAFGMHEELMQVIALMQSSHMAVFSHEGADGEAIVLRELVTERVCRAVCPAGYRGHAGELWYARVLPPPLPELDEHVVLTTPYALLEQGEREWSAYFDRSLPAGPLDKRLAAYESHMKWGPTRNYWSEFVLEAYVNHRDEVIFLTGLPDVAESRPHSSGGD